ncbi:component of IIS longevity pathway SMK-1-domain-containing protein [Kalaharituber pfeilii]|nr:component of IIS longevity pathway SMK-1-domain-containing protein [Kalaharituber pfeilii]
MAHGVLPSPPTQPRRVKVYELKNNDWFDRGTGYCTGHLMDEIPHIQVKSEEESDRLLLETRIIKDDGYQKQQETLIVWTEPNGTDMALSFQEPEGCAAIWEFVNNVQGMQAAAQGKCTHKADELLSDDANDALVDSVMLPPPELRNLPDIENMIRQASTSSESRNSLGKFILSDDYIGKLIPLLQVAEDLESLPDLHRLCNVAKMIILLNDTVIIEHIVTDEVILGIVGMLEYDPDFPTHKANHRQYLSDTSKFKEVVRIENPEIKKKIHWIYRLQYLKDVILARILDDPTFSVLNSLIFYHQVEVIQWIQSNVAFQKELFGIFTNPQEDPGRKKNAVLFVQQCCQIAKNIQAPARQPLYQTFIHHGLFGMIEYAMKSEVASVRIAGIDIIMAMIDHDSQMMRSFVFKQLNESQKPITDTLIELLQSEQDFGVKAQVSDAIKVLLDPQAVPHVEYPSGDKRKASTTGRQFYSVDPEAEQFLKDFYDESAKKLFAPLMQLDKRSSVKNLTVSEVALYSHLLEILWFFVRQHVFRSKFFIITEDLPAKIARLLESPEKHLKLAVVKLMRILVALRDTHFEKYLTKKNLLEPILDLVINTMPRDNLLNSACLEFFEFIKRENIRIYVNHLVDNYRAKLEMIKYVDTFSNIILRWEQWNERAPPPPPSTSEDRPRSRVNGGRWQGVKDMDPSEEEYFNTSDDDDVSLPAKETSSKQTTAASTVNSNGRPSTPSKPLVDYPEDDEDDAMEGDLGTSQRKSTTADTTVSTSISEAKSIPRSPPQTPKLRHVISSTTSQPQSPSPSPLLESTLSVPAPERLSEKRRRTEEEDDDELGKLSTRTKKRSPAMDPSRQGANRKRSTAGNSTGSPPAKKIAISLGATKAGSPPASAADAAITDTSATPTAPTAASTSPESTSETDSRNGDEASIHGTGASASNTDGDRDGSGKDNISAAAAVADIAVTTANKNNKE